MRILISVLLGIAIGAMCTVMALNALRAGTEFPTGVMAGIGYHFGTAKRTLAAETCDAAEVARHIDALETYVADIPAAFSELSTQASFSGHASELQRILAEAAAAPANCAALQPTISAIGEACQACHRDYRD